jgi:DNA-binding GntR family transcriptional regulator
MRELVRSGDPQRFHDMNEVFHAAIYAGARNAYLAEVTLATRARLRPFRRAQFRNVGRLAASHAEHERIVSAIVRADRVGAAAAMRAHIVRVGMEYDAYANAAARVTPEPPPGTHAIPRST